MRVRTESVAHGGHVVARHEGRVIFVRHALPQETVRVEVTEDAGRYLRADAVEVIEASPYRVEAPCLLARPGGCGGCDFQHVALPEQRQLKARVVVEQLRRLADIEWDVECESIAGDSDGLRWRTRMQYVVDAAGRPGLHKHRSHEVITVEDCLIELPDARPASGEITESVTAAGRTHTFMVDAQGFWQVHPGAPTALVETVLDQVKPRAGESALDLYAGVGLFARFLADEVGRQGRVIAVESDRQAARNARSNIGEVAAVVQARVDHWVKKSVPGKVDLVVLDPPRSGAKAGVVRALAALRPRAISYVACDPAALARDIATFVAEGYELTALRCLDLFPMTHHVECVALLTKNGSDLH